MWKFEELAQGLGWERLEELVQEPVQTLGGVFGDYVMSAFDEDANRGDTAFSLLGF